MTPDTPWTCPADHPIKGYVTMGARRVYYVPGDRFYEDASPERCYATEQEAQRDGARPPRGGDVPLPAYEIDHIPRRSVS